MDSQTKMQSSVLMFKNEEPQTKVKRPRSIGKKITAIFFTKVTILPQYLWQDKKQLLATLIHNFVYQMSLKNWRKSGKIR